MKASHAKFHHPYEPYDIQLGFMQKLYQCIEDGNVGIFESPTGTGKSLSLICAALTWLRDDERRRLFGEEAKGGLDWLDKAELDNQRKQLSEARREYEEKLANLRQNAQREQSKASVKRTKLEIDYREQDMLLDDYQETGTTLSDEPRLSSATLALLDQLKPQQGPEHVDEEERVQIIFCSRTHSQLSQFVNELKKIEIPASISEELETIKHISLGSRKNLCINPKVAALNSVTAINERCIDLQKPGIAEDRKCKFLPKKSSMSDQQRLETFKDSAVAEIADIEDVASLGRKQKICPYYATRSALPAVEILTLPYPLLLQKKARDALGVKLKDNVVIIDEAHNLTSAVADTLAVSIPLSHLHLAKRQLLGYCQKFKNKLKGLNRVYLAQLIKLLKKWIELIEAQDIGREVVLSSDTFNDLNESTGQIPISNILSYIQESKLVFKIEAYAELADADDSAIAQSRKSTAVRPRGVLAEFQSLLVATLNAAADGCFVISKGIEPTIKYLLLDPQSHFEDIVREARSVILAGGTMSPMSDWSQELFPYLDSQRLKTYSFDHIIAPSNVLVKSLETGPSGVPFDFKFGNRNSEQMLLELGSSIERLCKIIPDGVVVFFPSYDYLDLVVKVWKIKRIEGSLLERLAAVKEIFQESRTTNTDELLTSYTGKILQGKGALMFAIVGGKLSEGINFSDKLGRGVICIGLPYPNANSIEWSQKMQYIQNRSRKKAERSGLPKSEWNTYAEKAVREYADTITMRAVNQSIGRAIRHKNDYAAIFLIDKRFAAQRIQGKLPGWLKKSLAGRFDSWANMEEDCATLFAGK